MWLDMGDGLYPDILFHFTDKKALQGILSETFIPSYSKEKIERKTGRGVEYGVPMVSFCDLRLSELKNHMGRYGEYGIGMTKEWANRSGLNPVLYLNEKSDITNTYISAIGDFFEKMWYDKDASLYDKFRDVYESFVDLYCYMKNYESILDRRGRAPESYRFANEREWRYVPFLVGRDKRIVSVKDLDNKRVRCDLNSYLYDYKLSFHADDIKYLIVKDENEIEEMIRYLEHTKKHYDQMTRRRLASRILTAEQIRRDV
jgi:hypothetical protein